MALRARARLGLSSANNSSNNISVQHRAFSSSLSSSSTTISSSVCFRSPLSFSFTPQQQQQQRQRLAIISNSQQLSGVVVSTKMDKTAVVEVVRKVAHPKYKKIVRKSKKYLAHDELNECKEGFLVTVEPAGRTLSKRKKFVIGSILKRTELLPVHEEEEEETEEEEEGDESEEIGESESEE